MLEALTVADKINAALLLVTALGVLDSPLGLGLAITRRVGNRSQSHISW